VWHNRADIASLKKYDGGLMDRCRYGPAAGSPKRC
jgi:hypothetical protein